MPFITFSHGLAILSQYHGTNTIVVKCSGGHSVRARDFESCLQPQSPDFVQLACFHLGPRYLRSSPFAFPSVHHLTHYACAREAFSDLCFVPTSLSHCWTATCEESGLGRLGEWAVWCGIGSTL